MALAFVPSSLLLGVTTYLTTDVAAVPFLWVVPLAIYLLTFVVVFARPGRTTPRLPLELHALLVTVLVLIAFWRVDLDQRWGYPLHLGVFAITALVLHGELAATRPAPVHLTEFYLWMALGGALGGAFNALARAGAVRLGRRVPADGGARLLPAALASDSGRGPGRPPAGAGDGGAPRAHPRRRRRFRRLASRLLGVPVALLVSLAAGAIALALRAQRGALRRQRSPASW